MQQRPGRRKESDAPRIVGEVEAFPQEQAPPPAQQNASKPLTPNPFDVTSSPRLSPAALAPNSPSVIRTLVTLLVPEKDRVVDVRPVSSELLLRKSAAPPQGASDAPCGRDKPSR